MNSRETSMLDQMRAPLIALVLLAMTIGHPEMTGWVSGFYDIHVRFLQPLSFDYGRERRFCSMNAQARFFTPLQGKFRLASVMQFPGRIRHMDLFYWSIGLTLML